MHLLQFAFLQVQVLAEVLQQQARVDAADAAQRQMYER